MKIDNYTEPAKFIHSYGDVFRGEHPDQRTAKEFLQIIGRKLERSKWYPGKRSRYTRRALLCLTNGKTYNTVKEACEDLKIGGYNFAKHLRGDKRHSHIGGYRFREL